MGQLALSAGLHPRYRRNLCSAVGGRVVLLFGVPHTRQKMGGVIVERWLDYGWAPRAPKIQRKFGHWDARTQWSLPVTARLAGQLQPLTSRREGIGC